jgi:hypothetical protein
MAPGNSKKPICIDPNCVYSLRGFQGIGISSTRMREARKAGITLPTIQVGRRKFVRGSDAIEYLERLSQQVNCDSHKVADPALVPTVVPTPLPHVAHG